LIGSESILILSGFLFGIGFLGLLRQPDIVKTIISLEIMIFASILNFAYFAGEESIRSGHLAILIAVVLSGFVWALVFTILPTQSDKNTPRK
jgi:NADH:ubiquinone oxidoreductase subunit K